MFTCQRCRYWIGKNPKRRSLHDVKIVDGAALCVWCRLDDAHSALAAELTALGELWQERCDDLNRASESRIIGD